MENNKEKNLNAFLVPVSIVVAGIMVSGAIFAAQKGKTSEEVAGAETEQTQETEDVVVNESTNGSFSYEEGTELYLEDGKPVVALLSTKTCPHCVWVGDTYNSVVKEYQDAGKIRGYHFDFTSDGVEESINGATELPSELEALYQKYSGGYVPTFIIGGKYYRVGNAFESEDDLVKEAEELRRIIDQVLSEVN